MLVCIFAEGNGTPLQYSCLENPMDGGAWWAAVHGVAQSPTRLSDFTFMHGGGNGNPLQNSCLENPRDGGAWWAAVYGVAQSRTRLKRLSSSKHLCPPSSASVGISGGDSSLIFALGTTIARGLAHSLIHLSFILHWMSLGFCPSNMASGS